ncbi:hypothetical protein RBH26_13035 [Natronolimnohabitans sp. A-GB9]|uniref:hypothetical protein n=1 Tax=Natronolimnohabitans sp. A-GB9 TaxID=3069757 RepID=UPI0027B0E2C3|nr:hypothetical protein [Natronolimnohabitans sp. A-GB9]MDQ2051401.1 hypothetical protein [Natronolimnohabitans sp. A-GB9]
MREGTVHTGSPKMASDRRRFLQATAGIGAACIVGVRSAQGQEPTEIEDWNDLDAVREAPDDDYVMVADVDETTAGYDDHVGTPTGGWNPIGDLDRGQDEAFSGTFDGDGHEITGLQTDRPDEHFVGLFGVVDGGTVTDVTLTELDVTGNEGVGGLVGLNNGHSTVSKSRASGAVSGDGWVGGLVGLNGKQSDSPEVRESWAHSDVTGEWWVGGLVGQSIGVVSASWARGDVTGDTRVGGLVGLNGGEVWGCWTDGDVTGDTRIGGLVGMNAARGEVTASYWDEARSGQSEGVGTEDGSGTDVTGLSTDEMQGESARDSMSALDFEETWSVQTGPDDYPTLQWQATDDSDDDDSADADDSDEGDAAGAGAPDEDTADGLPGYGIGSALVGIGSVAYALARRRPNFE